MALQLNGIDPYHHLTPHPFKNRTFSKTSVKKFFPGLETTSI